MNLIVKTSTKCFLLVILIIIALSKVSPAAAYTINVVSVTEGILNLPLPRLLPVAKQFRFLYNTNTGLN